ncbi:MAG: NADH-quinone oxidoreductase subunit A [Candidatus Syntropharchaeia archaeon]
MLVIVGILFPLVAFILARILRPVVPDPEKYTTYECGEIPIGDTRVNFGVQFYLYALIFVIFDCEVAFLYPWAVAFGNLGLFAFIEMMIFIGILVVGYLYAWKRGALEWVEG